MEEGQLHPGDSLPRTNPSYFQKLLSVEICLQKLLIQNLFVHVQIIYLGKRLNIDLFTSCSSSSSPNIPFVRRGGFCSKL